MKRCRLRYEVKKGRWAFFVCDETGIDNGGAQLHRDIRREMADVGKVRRTI